MAKGDQGNVSNAVNSQFNNNSELRGNIGAQNQNFFNNYQTGVNQNRADYGNIMGGYQNFLNPSSGMISTGGGSNPSIASAEGGYQNFANTGGFSDADLQNIRARAIDPTRAVYANAQNNIDRQRTLQGGYSPNYTAATAKMSRDLASGISDANTNANASIAQMVQQGKLAGLGGLSSTGLGEQSLANSAAQAATAARLGGMSGMTSLYGATPGMTNVTGNQLLGSSGQKIGVENTGNSTLDAMIHGTQVPSGLSQGLGNAGGIMGLLGKAGKMFGFDGGADVGNTDYNPDNQLSNADVMNPGSPYYIPPNVGGGIHG